MSVSTLTAEEVEPRKRLTEWLIGAASWFLLPETRGRSLAQVQQRWERGSHRRPHSPRPEKVVA